MKVLGFNEAAEIVKSTLDIIDVVQRHVILKKSGRNYLGLCPFHKDRNPSMNVSREKNLFKCFSCGAGGDALTFLMKINNRTYGEIIRELANDQGIEIVSEGQSVEQAAQKRDLKQRILALNEKSLGWFQEQLQRPEGEPVRQYLAGRRIPEDIARRFQLGYAPPGWENLTRHLMATVDFVPGEPDILLNAGLSNQKTEGSGLYDRFRQRLIIPIQNDTGQIVAFGGRALSDDDKPKYLNSPETPVYNKSRVLYGLNLAIPAIRDTKTAVVMEGYFDVIATHMNGITQAVGSCGTALTDGHLKLLARYGAETVYLAFDSDEAGQKAALSAIALIEPYLTGSTINLPLTLKILLIPNGKDPDEFFRQQPGPEGFTTLMNEALPFLAFKCERAIAGLDTHTSEGRLAAANRLTPILAEIHQPGVQAEYRKKYAERIGVSEEALKLEIQRLTQARFPRRYNGFEQNRNISKQKAISKHPLSSLQRHRPTLTNNLLELRSPLIPRHVAAEKHLLRLLLLNTETYLMILPHLETLQFSDPIHQTLLAGIRRYTAQSVTHDNDARFLGTLIDELNHEYRSEPAVQQTLADLVLTAETLIETFVDTPGLGGISPQQQAERLPQFIQQQRQIIEAHQQQESMKRLRQEESNELELQYLLRSKLLEKRNTLNTGHTHQEQGTDPHYG